MFITLVLLAIVSGFILIFIVDISFNLRRMNNNLMKLLNK